MCGSAWLFPVVLHGIKRDIRGPGGTAVHHRVTGKSLTDGLRMPEQAGPGSQLDAAQETRPRDAPDCARPAHGGDPQKGHPEARAPAVLNHLEPSMRKRAPRESGLPGDTVIFLGRDQALTMHSTPRKDRPPRGGERNDGLLEKSRRDSISTDRDSQARGQGQESWRHFELRRPLSP